MLGTMKSFSAAIFLSALISILVIALTVLICVWTYRDAKRKGMNAIMWTLIVLLVPSGIGLIIYLIARIDVKKVTCSKCMKTVNGNTKYCSNCGQELIPIVEASADEEGLEKSQRHILIGFFAALGGTVVCTILLAAFLINGVVSAVSDGAKFISELSSNDTIEMLNDLDELLGEGGLQVHADDGRVIVKDDNGKELVRIDERKGSVDIDVAGIKHILDQYGIDYDENVTDEEVQEAIQDLFDELEDLKEATEE